MEKTYVLDIFTKDRLERLTNSYAQEDKERVNLARSALFERGLIGNPDEIEVYLNTGDEVVVVSALEYLLKQNNAIDLRLIYQFLEFSDIHQDKESKRKLIKNTLLLIKAGGLSAIDQLAERYLQNERVSNFIPTLAEELIQQVIYALGVVAEYDDENAAIAISELSGIEKEPICSQCGAAGIANIGMKSKSNNPESITSKSIFIAYCKKCGHIHGIST